MKTTDKPRPSSGHQGVADTGIAAVRVDVRVEETQSRYRPIALRVGEAWLPLVHARGRVEAAGEIHAWIAVLPNGHRRTLEVDLVAGRMDWWLLAGQRSEVAS